MDCRRLPRKTHLSKQEVRVLECSIAGLSDKGIAEELGLSLDTIRTYWQRIRAKAGGGARAEVIASYVEASARSEIEAFSSENKRLLEEIELRRNSERRLNQAYAIANMGCWERDMETGLIDWNETLWSVLAVSHDTVPWDLNGHLDHVHEEDRVRCGSAVRNLIQDGTPYEIIYRFRTPAGDFRIIHSRGDADRDSDGKIVRVRGTMQDVSGFLQNLELLGEMQTDLFATFGGTYEVQGQSPDLSLILDRTLNRVVYVGPGSNRILGISSQDAPFEIWKLFGFVAHSECAAEWDEFQAFAETLADGEWTEKEFSIRTSYGERRLVRTRIAVATRDPNGTCRTLQILVSPLGTRRPMPSRGGLTDQDSQSHERMTGKG